MGPADGGATRVRILFYFFFFLFVFGGGGRGWRGVVLRLRFPTSRNVTLRNEVNDEARGEARGEAKRKACVRRQKKRGDDTDEQPRHAWRAKRGGRYFAGKCLIVRLRACNTLNDLLRQLDVPVNPNIPKITKCPKTPKYELCNLYKIQNKKLFFVFLYFRLFEAFPQNRKYFVFFFCTRNCNF